MIACQCGDTLFYQDYPLQDIISSFSQHLIKLLGYGRLGRTRSVCLHTLAFTILQNETGDSGNHELIHEVVLGSHKELEALHVSVLHHLLPSSLVAVA